VTTEAIYPLHRAEQRLVARLAELDRVLTPEKNPEAEAWTAYVQTLDVLLRLRAQQELER
jgi:hypothetical protein